MTNLPNLIERLEAASGADKEIDRAIRDALGLQNDYSADWGPRGIPQAFPYTASIDAALTLVFEGANWTVARDGSRRFLAHVDGFTAGCATPALALAAAALRAQEVERG